jgi:hypothetical protein
VVPGRVQFEPQPDEGSALGVERDSADLTVVEAVEDVEVAQGCSAKRATVTSLLPHLVLDVGAAGL